MDQRKSVTVVITTELLERIAEIVMDNCEEVGSGRAESIAEQLIEFLIANQEDE